VALAGAALVVANRLARSPRQPVPSVAATESTAALTSTTPSSVAPLPATSEPNVAVATAVAPSAAPAAPGVDASHALLVVTCRPECDSVWVDGHPVAHASAGTLLPPGVHLIGANLAHHASTVKPVLLRRGEVHPFVVDFGR
jgi:hypothetical protein